MIDDTDIKKALAGLEYLSVAGRQGDLPVTSMDLEAADVAIALINDLVTELRQCEEDRAAKDDTGFAEFWQIYPRRVAKKPAERAWRRLSKTDRSAVLDHLPKRKWPAEKSYVPHPATFLNQRRWEDEDQETTVAPQEDIW